MKNKHLILNQSARLAATAALLAASACSYSQGTGPDAGDPARPANRQQEIPGYMTVRAQVFVPKCIRCHGNSGNVNLETYAAAVSALDHIKHSVLVSKSMPPSGSLTAEQIELVRAWTDAGGPENDGPAPSPSPSPSPSP